MLARQESLQPSCNSRWIPTAFAPCAVHNSLLLDWEFDVYDQYLKKKHTSKWALKPDYESASYRTLHASNRPKKKKRKEFFWLLQTKKYTGTSVVMHFLLSVWLVSLVYVLLSKTVCCLMWCAVKITKHYCFIHVEFVNNVTSMKTFYVKFMSGDNIHIGVTLLINKCI